MKLLKNEKVCHIKDGAPTVLFLKNLEQAYKNEEIEEFIMVARYNTGFIEYNWFGEKETSMYHLGLLERMKPIIMDWIDEDD